MASRMDGYRSETDISSGQPARGELGDRVQPLHGVSSFSHTTDLVAFAEWPPSDA